MSAMIERKCETCGRSFTARASKVKAGHGRFCSRQCRTPHNKAGATKKCLTCGNAFAVKPSTFERAKYCSRRCKNLAQKELAGEAHPLKREQFKVKCQWCGEAMTVHKCQLDKKRFCSRSCTGAYSTHRQGGRRSSIELLIERELEKLGLEFTAQSKKGKFLVDFFLPKLGTVIECDGDYWHSRKDVIERDARKNAYLESMGYRVIRLPEHAINDSPAIALKQALGS